MDPHYELWICRSIVKDMEAEAAEHERLGFPCHAAEKRAHAEYWRGMAMLVGLVPLEDGAGI